MSDSSQVTVRHSDNYRRTDCRLQIRCRTTTVAAGLRIHRFGDISVMYVASTRDQGLQQ
jgi:hypothetical protein